MADLVAFLTARYDEDEKIAHAAIGVRSPHLDTGTPGRWNPYLEGGDDGWAFEDDALANAGAIIGDEATTRHIARHDPAFVLADIAAKRRLVWFAQELWATEPSSHPVARINRQATYILRLLALPFAGHPAYREDWKP